MRCLAAIRWRILNRAKYLHCLQSDLTIDDPLSISPPWPPEDAPLEEEEGEDAGAEDGEEDDEEVDEETRMKRAVSKALRPLKEALWAPKEADEAEEGAAGEEEGEKEAKPRFPMLGPEETPQPLKHNFTEAIERIQEKQKEALDELGSKYYEELGEREITRKHGDPACTPERYIPATAAELQEMNAARLQELKDGAEQTLKAKVRYFRSMVARLTTAMSRVPTAVFLNINERAKRRSKFERRKLEDVYSDRKEAWLREREEHSVALKPSLGNSNARAELDALCDAENKRIEKATELTTDILNSALVLEAKASWSFFHETLHATETLLLLFDTIVQPGDLVPTEEDVMARRKTLLTLMKEYEKSQAGTAREPPPEGKAFHRRTWKGMRKGEVGASCVYGMAKRLEEDASVTGKALLGEVVEEELTDEVEGNDTANHAAVIRLRERAYNQYHSHFVVQTEKLVRGYKAILREEQRWQSNWNGLVSSLKDS
eukprot:CAMPEP_0177696178 /NCGR_PEP_ID=MMETSP0484_2-20121128/3843_1 /TAXON_ID=354590 /ORGANISM="Rhodomonas lens, Strain RHODO" /LENGTH=488 /DNA_ID=CAMNT_0019207135 /DNA_START=21 /DNA_END=1487 /DNA_ORIENTATION=+